jgi:hypothetical protein
VEDDEFPYNSSGFALRYESQSCSGSYANLPDGQTAGDAAIADICAETFYQPPTFKPINWLPADVFNFEVFLPMLFGGKDNAMGSEEVNTHPNTPLDIWILDNYGEGRWEEVGLAGIQVEVNGTQLDFCEVVSTLGGPPFEPDGEAGITMSCRYETDREIIDYEWANVTLYGFDCEQALAIDRFSIPPRPLVGAQPQQEVGEQSEEDESGLDSNGCYEGDAYSVDESLCCPPGSYWTDGVDDSCDPPFYNPYP